MLLFHWLHLDRDRNFRRKSMRTVTEHAAIHRRKGVLVLVGSKSGETLCIDSIMPTMYVPKRTQNVTFLKEDATTVSRLWIPKRKVCAATARGIDFSQYARAVSWL